MHFVMTENICISIQMPVMFIPADNKSQVIK